MLEGTRSLRFPPGERVAGGTRPLEMAEPPEPDRAPGGTRPLVMPEPPAAQAAPPAPPLPRVPQPSASPPTPPTAPPSENDWLYSGDVDVAAILAEDDRSRLLSAQPPSELTGRLMEPPPPPPPPAAPARPAAAAPAPPPPPPSPDVPASLVDDQRPLPAVEFSEWMAMQAAAAGTPPPVYPGTPPSRDELARLPAWVRSALSATGAPPTPSVATPPTAARPGPTRLPVPVPLPAAVPPILGGRAVSPLAGPPEAEAADVEARRRSRTEKLFEHLARPQDAEVVLRCPHCGEVLDKDALLRQLERALNP